MDIANAIVTGGVFTVNNNTWPQVLWEAPLRSSRTMDRFLEAVAHSAFHDSVERSEPIGKHRHSDAAAHGAERERIRRWASQNQVQTVFDDDGTEVIYSTVAVQMPVLWLTGQAGAGKSTLAQSIADELDADRRLLASFFFARSDATRNHPRALVATLAYQIYQTVPPAIQDRMLAVVDRDPLIFKRSMAAQFERLVIAPLHDLIRGGYFDDTMAPRVFVIDGLDECLDTAMRRCVLDMVFDAVFRHDLPFIFLISCRPELDLQPNLDSHKQVVEKLVLEKGRISALPLDDEQDLRDDFLATLVDHPYSPGLPFSHLVLMNNPHKLFQNEGGFCSTDSLMRSN